MLPAMPSFRISWDDLEPSVGSDIMMLYPSFQLALSARRDPACLHSLQPLFGTEVDTSMALMGKA